jgi:hypothetical protein
VSFVTESVLSSVEAGADLAQLGTDGVSAGRVPEVPRHQGVHQGGGDISASRSHNHVAESQLTEKILVVIAERGDDEVKLVIDDDSPQSEDLKAVDDELSQEDEILFLSK